MVLFSRETVQIPSVEAGVNLDVWFYKPEGKGPFPVVVAGHGMTLIKDAGLDVFGERWASDAGYASLIFDYRYFGKSGGEPRNLVDLQRQLEDYKSVITWARKETALIRNDKIVVMGSALSGLSISTLAIEDSGLAGAMAHSPVLDGYATLMALPPPNPRFLFWAIADWIKGQLGFSPIFIKAVGKPGEFCFLNTPSCHQGFEAVFSKCDVTFANQPNVLAPRLAFQIMSRRPGAKLSQALCPVLVVMTQEDDLISPEVSRTLALKAPEKVQLVEAPGGHFDIMAGGKGFDININAQLEFLRSLI